MHYFIGILGTLAGFMLVWKTTPVLNFTGRIEFAEKYLSTAGGTRFFIKIVGVVIILISWMYMFNLGGWIIYALFLPGRPAPQQ